MAAWRTWVLLARDTILDGPRDAVAPEGSKQREFLECPYCSGFWTAGIWVTAWDVTRLHVPGIVVWMAGWWAVAALVIVIELAVDRLSGD